MVEEQDARDEYDLEAGARFVVYEYDMFVASCFMLSHYMGPSQIMRNLMLEGVLLHARNLADFFKGTQYEDDIKASDFLTASSDSADPLMEDRRRLNKRLSHPSYERATTPKSWDVVRIYRTLTDMWTSFYDQLANTDPDRAAWFHPATSLPVEIPFENWEPHWIEAESDMIWWEADDLQRELHQLMVLLKPGRSESSEHESDVV